LMQPCGWCAFLRVDTHTHTHTYTHTHTHTLSTSRALRAPGEALHELRGVAQQRAGVGQELPRCQGVQRLLHLCRAPYAVLQHLLALRGRGVVKSVWPCASACGVRVGARARCRGEEQPCWQVRAAQAPPTNLEGQHGLLVGVVEANAQHHQAAVELAAGAVKEVVFLPARRSGSGSSRAVSG
jgi:hypothetical protein